MTEILDRDAQAENGTFETIGAVDAFALSMAELNGTLGAVNAPVLSFDFASSELDQPRRNCLKAFGRLALRADDMGPLRLRIIGHADSVDTDAANNSFSLQRALLAKRVMMGIPGLSSRIPVATSGRGEAEPWACGPPDGAEEAKVATEFEPCPLRLQMLRTAQDPGEVKVRNDRWVEFRVESSLFAGPNYDLLQPAIFGPGGSVAITDSKDLLRHLGILRHYPAGIAPLHPVVVGIGERSDSVRQACSLPDQDSDRGRKWLDTDWQMITLKDDPEVRWNQDPGLVVSGINSLALGYKLLVRLRASPDVQRRSEFDEPPGQVELMLATQIVQEGLNKRPAAAVGVPDPWRVRVRLPEFLKHLLNSDPTKLKPQMTPEMQSLLRRCLGLPDEKSEDEETLAVVIASLKDRALEALPRDGQGLMAYAHDYHAPTGMFGLQPGLHLRLLTGRDQLASNLAAGSGRQDFVDLASDIVLPLYAAPTQYFVASGQDAVSVLSSREGHHSVTLDPGLALRWGPNAAMTNLSQRAIDGTFAIGDPAALELLLSGRLAYVLPPSGTVSAYDRPIPRPFNEMRNFLPIRDTLIIAAKHSSNLEEFLRRPRTNGIFGSFSAPSACAWGSMTDTLGGRGAQVLCGLFTQPMSASLLIDVEINGETHRVPLGTQIGAVLPPDMMAPCFAGVVADKNNVMPFKAENRLAKRITLPRYITEDPAAYDPKDCRLLALPLIHGATLSWMN